MSEEVTSGTGPAEGQPATGTAPATGATTTAGTGSGEGQPAGTGQTTAPSGTGQTQTEDSFFDPKDLSPELMPAYKQMQRAFGKKMEEIKAHRQKIDAYDAFSKDPVTQLQQMASQMGYRLTRAEAQAVADQQGGENTPWEPQTWEEVMARAKQEVLKELSPVFSELQTVKKQNIEKMLDDSCPDWRQYEDEMTALLQEHPTLAKDPAKLYALAVPHEILETRATQAALKKLQQKVDSSKVGSTSTTKTQAPAEPDKPLSFNDAVNFARARLAEQGLKAPH